MMVHTGNKSHESSLQMNPYVMERKLKKALTAFLEARCSTHQERKAFEKLFFEETGVKLMDEATYMLRIERMRKETLAKAFNMMHTDGMFECIKQITGMYKQKYKHKRLNDKSK